MRFHFSALLLGTLVLTSSAGCNSDEPPPPPGEFETPAATATVGDLVFVTSPEDDGLRVLAAAGSVASESCTDDTDCGGGQYCESSLCIRAIEEVLRAPDPLFSLVIPALRSPGALLSLPGAEGERSLLVVTSQSDPQLRFVDADALVPVGLPVALPGRALGLVFSPSTGAVFVLVDSPQLLSGGASVAGIARLQLETDLRVPDQSVAGAAAQVTEVWGLPSRGRALAISELGGETVLWVASSEDAELLRVLAVDGAVSRVPISAQLRHLVASPASTFTGGSSQLGARLFGLSISGREILAFQGDDGSPATPLLDGTEVRPVPIPGGATGFTVTSDLLLTLPGDGGELELPWALLIPTVNGDAIYLDGLNLRTIDSDGDQQALASVVSLLPEELDTTAPRIVSIENPDYDPQDTSSPERIPAIQVTDGVTRSRTWAVAWRAVLPGQDGVLGLLRDEGAEVHLVPTDPPDNLDGLVQAGDQIEILTHLDPPEGCASIQSHRYRVARVDPATSGLVLALPSAGGTLPDAACVTTPLRYQVRSAEFLISASGLSETYRASAGSTFTYAGVPFLAGAAVGPDLQIELEAGQTDLFDGATRLIEISSGADPWRIPAGDTLGSSARFPGSPSIYSGRAGAPETARVYLPFAGLNALFAFDLATGDGRTAIR